MMNIVVGQWQCLAVNLLRGLHHSDPTWVEVIYDSCVFHLLSLISFYSFNGWRDYV